MNIGDRYFFTADEHYGHGNIIKYCNRPFSNVKQMDAELIRRHNAVVPKDGITIHCGDFFWGNKMKDAEKIINQLNGFHIFLAGSHDNWMNAPHPFGSWEKKIDGQWVVACHYAMRTWPRSHHGAWQLFGHSHGTLVDNVQPSQLDVGVDSWAFAPVSWKEICDVMRERFENVEIRRGEASERGKDH